MLGDVLVVTVRKSFWASPEAERWPRRVYARVYRGHSSDLVNAVPAFLRALLAIWQRPPRVVLLGSVERTVPWFVRARRLGLLRGAKLVVTNQLHLSPAQLEQVDRVIVYASAQAAALREKGVFLPLPADGDLEAARATAAPGGYVFSGGGAGRDFATLVEAVRGTELELELVVFAPDSPAFDGLPPNVCVRGPLPQQEFLGRMAGAAVVAVPLDSPESPHGQTTLVQALALGRPVVATRAPGTVDYVPDGPATALVEAGDAAALREALLRLIAHPPVSPTVSAAAGYDRFAERLAAVCAELARSA